MKFEYFKKILGEYQKATKIINDLYDIGFDLTEGKYRLNDSISTMFDVMLEVHYTEEGIDWINWFIWENDWGKKDWNKIPTYNKNGVMELDMKTKKYGATDEDGNPICYNIKSLWEYIEKNHKL